MDLSRGVLVCLLLDTVLNKKSETGNYGNISVDVIAFISLPCMTPFP